MQNKRDPVMEVFNHHDNIVEIRRVVAKQKRKQIPKWVWVLSVAAAVAFFWICFARGVWEFIT